MKTLYLLRHAKSSWKDLSLADFDRPLNPRGRKAAPFMGEVMRKYEFVPELIISSPAERARQTIELASEAGSFDGELRFDQRIYGASPSTLLDIISAVEEKFDSLMLVGHNPTFERMTTVLTGEIKRTPTAALAVIDLDIGNWSEVRPESGRLRKFIRPKEEKKKS